MFMILRRVAILVACAASTTACGAGQKTGTGTAPSGPIAAAARHVPTRATYALFFARTDEGLAALRDIITPFGAAEPQLSPQFVDQAIRQDIGFSLIDAADLLDHGVDTSRPLALFSTDYLPTLLVPVADATKVSAAVS